MSDPKEIVACIVDADYRQEGQEMVLKLSSKQQSPGHHPIGSARRDPHLCKNV